MLGAARALSEGGAEPPGVHGSPELRTVRSLDTLAPNDRPWQEFAFERQGAGAAGR
jgi:hypothetical protein